MKRYVIVNRTRFTISMTIFMTIIFMFVFSVVAVFNKVEGYASPTYELVTVAEGDTVWNIAKQYRPNEDIRKAILDIGSLNELNDYDIKPGDIIKIPIDGY